MKTRKETLELVKKHTKNKNLIKHMFAVEAGMKAYAQKYGEDIEKWGICGLVHDLDYEKMGEEHPSEWGRKVLEEEGYDEEIINAVMAHGVYDNPEMRKSKLAKALIAVDPMTGFIVACALVRPNQISDLKVSSVKKKLKNQKFAESVDRNRLRIGVEELGENFDEHTELIIRAMRQIKSDLGLK